VNGAIVQIKADCTAKLTRTQNEHSLIEVCYNLSRCIEVSKVFCEITFGLLVGLHIKLKRNYFMFVV